MMKLFKKKKPTINIQQQQQPQPQPPPTITTKKAIVVLQPTNNETNRTYTPPTLVMPKPRKLLTPTRAILDRFDRDKTQVDELELVLEEEQEVISPILLPISHHNKKKSLIAEPYSTHSDIFSAATSRVYESAVESLAGDDEVGLPSLYFSNNKQDGLLSVQQRLPDNKQQGLSLHQQQQLPDNKQYAPKNNTNSNKHQGLLSVHQLQPGLLLSQQQPRLLSPTQPPQPQPQSRLLSPPPLPKNDLLLQQLKHQVELMEKQRILDREEWVKKELELLTNRQQMMETLKETKEQLTRVIKTRKEEQLIYQRELQLQQLKEESSPRITKSKSEEYFKYNTGRSSSRLSRHNSNASSIRNDGFDPSPSTTIVSPSISSTRQRARSIDYRRRRSVGKRPSIIDYNEQEGFIHYDNDEYYYRYYYPRQQRQQQQYYPSYHHHPQYPQQQYHHYPPTYR